MDKIIAQHIDHTLLKASATKNQIEKLCGEAVKYGFPTVCVNQYWVPLCSELLENTPVNVCTVVGFPLGASPIEIKSYETEWCLNNGADEIDMVMNIGEALSGNWTYMTKEIRTLAEIVHRQKCILKVIFENCLLSRENIVEACRCSMEAEADFVKTSTGLSTGGATVEDVKLMLDTVGKTCKVKAAGGIRTTEQALEMIYLGVTRIGTSAGVEIVTGKSSTSSY